MLIGIKAKYILYTKAAAEATKVENYQLAIENYKKAIETQIDKEAVILVLKDILIVMNKKINTLEANINFTDDKYEKQRWRKKVNELKQIVSEINTLVK